MSTNQSKTAQPTSQGANEQHALADKTRVSNYDYSVSAAVPPSPGTVKTLRVNHAVDMLLEYLLATKDTTTAEVLANESDDLYADELGSCDTGGSSSASKSARRMRRPPPDLSS